MLSINLMAQIDTCDHNWKVVVFDDFNQPNRQFDTTFQEPLGKWISFSPILYPSGVTKYGVPNSGDTIFENQIYQWNHSLFDSNDSVLKLFSDFIRETPIRCNEQIDYYRIPPHMFDKNYWCDNHHSKLNYYSGMIESLPGGYGDNGNTDKLDRSLYGRFQYGYFEIRFRIPVHKGAFCGFWLWGAQLGQYYEAIDIFEYSWDFTGLHGQNTSHPPFGSPRHFSSGVDFNHTPKGRVFTGIPEEEEDLTGWHVFSCEWLPERVTLYRDGNIISEVTGRNNIPSHPLTLKTTYAIDKYVYAVDDSNLSDHLMWKSTDTMYVDYIKVFQLNWDCDEDKIIACQTDLDTLTFKVKKSYNITSTLGNVKVAETCNMTFRATDYFEITGPFQTDLGGQMTVIMQECPDAINKEFILNKKDEP